MTICRATFSHRMSREWKYPPPNRTEYFSCNFGVHAKWTRTRTAAPNSMHTQWVRGRWGRIASAYVSRRRIMRRWFRPVAKLRNSQPANAIFHPPRALTEGMLYQFCMQSAQGAPDCTTKTICCLALAPGFLCRTRREKAKLHTLAGSDSLASSLADKTYMSELACVLFQVTFVAHQILIRSGCISFQIN
jgi:hypothetical protein